MKLRRPEPRAERETVTALIDVVFFLLVFFMIVGRMDATAPFEVLPPVGTTGRDLPSGGLTVSAAPDGRYAVGGKVLDRAELIDLALTRIGEDNNLLVRINADRETELRHVLPVISELEAAGAKQVVLIVTPNRS